MRLCLVCGQRFESDMWRCSGCGYMPTFHNGYPVFAPELMHGDGSDAEFRFAELFELEMGSFWFRARNRLVVWALRRYFPFATSLLEVGCGTGFVLSGIREALPTLALSASDVLVRGLAFAQTRLPGVSFFQADARHIPFEAEFDVVGAFDVLEHIEQDEDALRAVYRAIRPGGGILVCVPQHPWLWSYVDECGHHKRRYTRPELVAKVERAGFQVIRTTSFMSLLLVPLSLSRLRWHGRKAGPDVLAEFGIAPFLNRMLQQVLAIERLAIISGISFPVGGSLLLVGRRA
jgi:SAM-dependent methyltransferase